MRRAWERFAFVFAIGAAAAACNAIWGIDLPNRDAGGTPDGSVPDRAAVDAPDAPTVDSSRDGSVPESGQDRSTPDSATCPEAQAEDVRFSGVCPNAHLPTMAKVNFPLEDAGFFPPFCVDTTEVTNAEYTTFLASVGTPELPCPCAWKDGGVSHPMIAGKPADGPIANVDWCDAYAYCRWAGKRLCGALGGGPVPYMEVGTVVDQYFVACGGTSLGAYPYGSSGMFSPDNCNVVGADYMGNPQVETNLTNCTTSLTKRVYNMVGNVEEWIDSCAAASGQDDLCVLAGGSCETPSPGSDAKCNYRNNAGRGTTSDYVGFRCCSP